MIAVLSFLAVMGSMPATAQPVPSPATDAKPAAAATPDQPTRVPNDLARFFAGNWQGQGAFASGRKIEADVSFEASMDGQWLTYRHADRAPNSYKAQGFWGYERTSHAFVMVLADNFGGARLFSSDGWKDDKLVFEGRGAISPSPSSGTSARERFTFAKQSADEFRMSYETSKDGTAWRLVDSLTFKRKP
ncbi:MAG: DUF1579 family protein [Proteobacteria bacterium]|nr:DUF1579 family protein [Pseudomonadota bacterium]MBS0217912.1 DUF1579 family protein [Pseudomonadota bacterium]